MTLVLLLAASILSPAQRVAALSPFNPLKEQVTIVFKQQIPTAFNTSISSSGGEVVRSHSIIPAMTVRLPAVAITALRQRSDIVGIYEDMKVKATLSQSVPQIKADLVQTAGNTGTGVRVCVVDTGVGPTHSSLPAVVAQSDFVNNDAIANDDNGHGTHVAGIIASQHVTYKGVSPGVSLMAAKVLDDSGFGDSSDVIAGIEWCVQNGADVINMSLGGGTYTAACDNAPVAAAGNQAALAGVVVVAASGNDGRSDRISAPGCGSKIISVGAVSKTDVIGAYSNGGSQLDVVAPGTQINAPYLGNTFDELTGTSMATPHVAGASALLLSAVPTLTPTQVQTILQSTAVDLGSPGFDTRYGHGRIDVQAAYLSATGNPPPPPPVINYLLSDTFQTGTPLWNLIPTGWRITTPAEKAVPGTVVGNTVFHADNCLTGCTATLATPLNLSGYGQATLRFWRFVDTSLDANEALTVEAFNGTSWQQIFRWTNGAGDDDTWHQETWAVPSQFMTSTFNLRFTTNENSSIEESEIDNVELVVTAPLNQAPVAHAGLDQVLKDSDGTGTEPVTLTGIATDADGTVASVTWKKDGNIIGSGTTLTTSLPVGLHTFTLTVVDDKNATTTDTVVVTVQANQAPIANAGVDQTIADGNNDGIVNVTLLGIGTDSDGTIAQYVWSENNVVIGSGASLTFPVAVGSHTYVFKVIDNAGAETSDSVNVLITNNIAPVANAGVDQTIGDGNGDGFELVTLNGTNSTDTDGTIDSYQWSETGSVLSTNATFSLLLSVGTHTFTLKVKDNGGTETLDTVVITIGTNFVPIANAGANQTKSDGNGNGFESVTLNGNGSTDSDGTIVQSLWSKNGNHIGTGSVISFDVPTGTHTFTLTVTDNGGATATDDVIVTVNPNQAPVANAGVDQTLNDVNGNGTESVTLSGATSSDSDGTIVQYVWVKNDVIMGTSATLATTLPVGSHTYELIVTDNGNAVASDTVVVTIQPPVGPVTILNENFQNGFSQWNVTTASNGTWRIIPPSGNAVPQSAAGNTVAHGDDCDNGCTVTLNSARDLQTFSSASLQFWRYIDRSIDRNEFLAVDVSGNGGASWQTLATWTDGSGDDSTWHRETIAVPGNVRTSNFLVRFRSLQSFSTEEVEIDDVLLTGTH